MNDCNFTLINLMMKSCIFFVEAHPSVLSNVGNRAN